MFNFNEVTKPRPSVQPQQQQQQQEKKQIFNPRKYVRSGFTIDQVIEMKQTFDIFDKDQGGTLSYEELKDAMQILGFIEDDDSALAKIIEAIDTDKNNKLSFDEFMGFMYANIAENDTDADLQKVFSYFVDLGNSKFLADDDEDDMLPSLRSGPKKQNNTNKQSKQQQFNPLKSKISIQMLRNIAKEIGEDVEDEDLIEMLERADQDDDGQVGFSDFKYIVKWQSEETQAEFEQQQLQQMAIKQKGNQFINTSQDI